MIISMKTIIFVCHGNICRSPVGAILFNKLAKENGIDGEYVAISRATSLEEIGNDIYPPMKKVLNQHGVLYGRHYAEQITLDEYLNAEYIFYMDTHNLYYLERMFGKNDKYLLISRFLDDKVIEDPWYTGRFEYVYKRIEECVQEIIKFLKED